METKQSSAAVQALARVTAELVELHDDARAVFEQEMGIPCGSPEDALTGGPEKGTAH